MHTVYLQRRIAALLLIALFTVAAAGIASADGGGDPYVPPERPLASPEAQAAPVPSVPTPVECTATASELRCAGSLR